MADIGKYNQLTILRETDFGVYLDGENLGDILLPGKYLPDNVGIDDVIDVFIYCDSEDRLIATTEKPYAQVGEFAYLDVKAVNEVGAFLDWGLAKDLLVPFREQKQNLEVNQSCLVYVYLDVNSNRIAASAKLEKFLDNIPSRYSSGEEVQLMIAQETELGYKAIINNLHWGMLYKNEVFQNLSQGDRVRGYIQKIRGDEKLDLTLHKPGQDIPDDLTEKILTELHNRDGFLTISDKSDPDEIYTLFQVSKKKYKKALGHLYKNRLILMEPNGIRLAEN